MKRFILGLMLLLPVESISARYFSGGALAGSLIEKHRCKKRYYDYPPCDYNYYGSYNKRPRNIYA